jgi:hypothetical protein
MMLFRPEHVQLILNGTKTQTRRIWKKKRANVGSTHLAKTKMISKEYFAKLQIQAVYQEFLDEISEADAHAEGYPSRAAYFDAFMKINHMKQGCPTLHIPVWVVGFQVVA